MIYAVIKLDHTTDVWELASLYDNYKDAKAEAASLARQYDTTARIYSFNVECNSVTTVRWSDE